MHFTSAPLYCNVMCSYYNFQTQNFVTKNRPNLPRTIEFATNFAIFCSHALGVLKKYKQTYFMKYIIFVCILQLSKSIAEEQNESQDNAGQSSGILPGGTLAPHLALAGKLCCNAHSCAVMYFFRACYIYLCKFQSWKDDMAA